MGSDRSEQSCTQMSGAGVSDTLEADEGQSTLSTYTAEDRADRDRLEDRVDGLADRVDELEETVVGTLAQLGEKLDRIDVDRADDRADDRDADRDADHDADHDADRDADGGEGNRTIDQVRGYQ